MPKGTAHVMFNQKMGMLMYEGELEPAPADKSYQLWLVPAQGNPISAGVFSPGSEKASHFMMKLPEGVAAKAFAVTLEPCWRPAATHRAQSTRWPCGLTPFRDFLSRSIYHFTRTR